MLRIMLVNLNLDPAELDGTRRLQDAIDALLQGVEHSLSVTHFETLRQNPTRLTGVDGLVLGPQGTPFSQYDAQFLPWLRALVEQLQRPVLAVCGGMQALALAYGGKLAATFGGEIGHDYAGHEKLRGPLLIDLQTRRFPAWFSGPAVQALGAWQTVGSRAFESHVEQVSQLSAPLFSVARSAPTPIEAFMHADLAIMASQFHPELGWDDGCQAGQLWLGAWLQVVVEGAKAR